MTTKCIFKACHHTAAIDSIKCWFHRNRDKCEVVDCFNQACARKRCVSHGGKRACDFPGCTANARVGAYCGPHGSTNKKRHCTIDGCTKFAHARRRCVAHGGGRLCNMAGCQSQSRNGGYCQRHGGKMKKEDEIVVKEEVDQVVTWKNMAVFDVYDEGLHNYYNCTRGFGVPRGGPSSMGATFFPELCEVDRMMLDVLLTIEL
ncbi:Aste57867_19845 [Aphanomyces stellatus]|uniref:Aste57867_19845 protein n=1 Tax=Aphanomyces stellatus TaxID=120398 RepID=A0A485LF26_9STRA|nr:hypothetical protein As57867_019780 [Aphanomyces stellatus]VFT96543.1 Aste57867_19845 [Aphanomyces stellatus]